MNIILHKSETYLPEPNFYSGRTQDPRSQVPSRTTTIKKSTRNSISSVKSLFKLTSKASQKAKNINIHLPTLGPSSKIDDFKQSVIEHCTERSRRRLKRYESNGILPHRANLLRKDTLLDVEITKKINQFKREIFTQKCLQERNSIKNPKEARRDSNTDVLEKLKFEITRQKTRFLVTNNKKYEDEEEKDLERFADYVNWLNNDGKKQYEALPIF